MLKKAFIKAAVAALIASGSLLSLQAVSSTAYGTETDYYSDATYTEIVGNFIFDCGNRSSLSGVKTPYAKQVLRWRC